MSPFVIAGMGIGIVFLVLTIIASLMFLIAKLDQKPLPKAPEAGPAEPKTDEQGIDPELLAVITAAAFAVLKRPCKIRRIRPYQPSPWAIAGRESIAQNQGTSAREIR